MMRIMLFCMTNLSVMILFGSIISVLGCCSISGSITLMGIAGIFGLGGAFISLLLSKSMALSAVRGVVISKAANDMEYWLLQTTYSCARRLSITTPQLAIYVSQDMNAFATGARKDSSVIAISSSLLENMKRESIEAVIAHEMSHIASGDMMTMTLIQGVLNTFVIFVSRSLTNLIYYWISVINDAEHDNSNRHVYSDGSSSDSNISNSFIYMLISSVLELFFGVIASIIVFWFSRYREFYADAGAAKLVGCEKMIDALQQLKYNHEYNQMINSSMITLCISNSVYNNKKTNFLLCDLFSSHPSLDKRIKALQCRLYL